MKQKHLLSGYDYTRGHVVSLTENQLNEQRFIRQEKNKQRFMIKVVLLQLLLLSLFFVGCTPEELAVCEPDREGPNGERVQMIMSKSIWYVTDEGITWYDYRLGCEGAYGTFLGTPIEYEIGDWYTTHQQYEPGLNHGQ